MNESMSHGIMPNMHPEKTPVVYLSPEQQAEMKELEEKSAEVLRHRLELASFTKEYRFFFGENVTGDFVNVLSERIQAGEDIQSLIDVKKVEVFVQQDLMIRKVAPTLLRPAKIVEGYIRNIVAQSLRAIETYRIMKQEGGLFGRAAQGTKSEEAKKTERFYEMRTREFQRATISLEQLQAKVLEDVSLKDYMLSLTGKYKVNPRDVAIYDADIQEGLNDIQILIESSPEAYLADRMKRLEKLKATFDANGRIVETPYVLSKIKQISDTVKQHRPVFVHGELGSGKTELAMHVSRTKLSQAHVARWSEAHPEPKEEDANVVWKEKREMEREPLFVSGHKGLEISELIAAKAIKLKEAPLPLEQVRIITEEWLKHEQEILQEAQAAGETAEQLELRKEELKNEKALFVRAKQEAFRAPVETRTLLGPIVQAMKEGRPVIIDEMNAIPHHTLIMMNDLLNRRPGERVSLPYADMEPFVVQEGFAVLATGNYKPEDGERYVGRQKIDSAFLSRFGIVSYDYLPSPRLMEAVGLTPDEQREYRESNESFQMFVARLLEKDLSADIPENAFLQLKKMAFVMRNVQDVFAERSVSKVFGKTSVDLREMDAKTVLQENVPSLRHMLPLLDKWRDGKYQTSLDQLVFSDFILRSSARPAEMTYLYKMFKTQGDFFPQEAGWPNSDASADELIQAESVEHAMIKTGDGGMKTIVREPTKRFTIQEIVEELYGSAPERTYVTDEFLVQDKKEEIFDTKEQENFEMVQTVLRLKESLVAFRATTGIPSL